MTSPLTRRRRLTATGIALLALALIPGLNQVPALADDGAADPATAPAQLATPAATHLLGDPVGGLRDLDDRGSTGPSSVQRTAAGRLNTLDVRWNRFGTPASLLPSSGALATATSANPVTAARNWLVANSSVFGRSAAQMRALKLVDDHRLVDSSAHVVLFHQTFGGLDPALGSLVTVGVAHGKIAYVSSSLSKTTSAIPQAKLTPFRGWLAAARNVGLDLPLSKVSLISSEVSGGWTRLTVPGIAQEQQVRLRALAMADGTVRPVLEANVVDVAGSSSRAYTVMVDAVSGAILHRENQVENAVSDLGSSSPSTITTNATAQTPAQSPAQGVGGGLAATNGETPFNASITATACGPMHSFELTDDKTKQIVVVAAAVNAANDITIKLFDDDDKLLSAQDLATSPEVIGYSSNNIPAGTYKAQVCPFDSPTTPLLPPFNYAMTVTTSNQDGPSTGGSGPINDNPKWRFFTANPRLDSPRQTPKNSVIGCWETQKKPCTIKTGRLRDSISFGPWDTYGTTGVSSNTTVGNNANTHEAWASPLTPGGTAQAPVSASRNYLTPFTDRWNNTKCDPTQLRTGGNDINFAVQNLFVTHNRMHDWSYYLGFSEDAYNLQLDNAGRGGTDGDQEVGNVQAGAIDGGAPSYMGRDNANQIALQDGVPGITNQYLFQPIAGAFYAPCTDGDLDQGIVGHEYTHAISNRMIGGPDEGITSEQGGAMGESWSDLDAAEFQFEHDYHNGGNTWAVGVYATGNKSRAIRDYAINHNPLNYSDYGFDTTGPEVHADGEIWNGTQWEVRQAMVNRVNKKHPYRDKRLQLNCAEGNKVNGVKKVNDCPGNRRWISLIFDGFLLQQGATSMLDARDSMIAADRMRFNGKDVKALWDAFARRGMGKGAHTKDADNSNPTPSFRSPTSKNTKVTFKTSGPGAVYVGDFEARATPIADTYSKTKLKRSAKFTPGTYTMTYVGAKHGFKRFTMTVTGQKKKKMKIKAGRNLAAKKSGAKIIDATKGGRNKGSLIDGTENFGWAGITSGNVDKSHPRIAVDLAGGVHKIRTLNVSGMLAPAFANVKGKDDDADAGSRFTALRKFAVEACVKNCKSSSATWKRFFTSKGDAFPAVRPRPTGPNLNMRTFGVKTTKAAALRLVVLENQCTGFAGYAGELDNDPTNATDCKTASDRGTIVHVAELQAFTTKFRSSYNGGSRGLHTVRR